MKQFKLRKASNKNKKQIDNSRLPAGSSTYFYCRFCGDFTESLPESYIGKPKTICTPCQVLHKHGLI